MLVKEVLKSEVKDKFRNSTLILDDERTVFFSTLKDKPEPLKGDEFGDDWIVTEETNSYGKYLKLHKKQKSNYQKEFDNPRKYLVNLLSTTIIPIIKKEITREAVYKEMEYFLEWENKLERDNIPVENKTSQETPKNEKKEPLTDRQTAIIATLSHCGYGDDDDQRHFVLESITGVNSIHLVKIEESQLFWDFVNEAIGRKREKGEPLTKKDLDNLKIQLDKLGE